MTLLTAMREKILGYSLLKALTTNELFLLCSEHCLETSSIFVTTKLKLMLLVVSLQIVSKFVLIDLDIASSFCLQVVMR